MKKIACKQKFFCVDGPMRGHYIYLQMDGKTLEFKLDNQQGRYVPNGVASVRWEPAQ